MSFKEKDFFHNTQGYFLENFHKYVIQRVSCLGAWGRRIEIQSELPNKFESGLRDLARPYPQLLWGGASEIPHLQEVLLAVNGCWGKSDN